MKTLQTLSLVLILTTSALAADDLEKRASWQIPDAEQIRSRLDEHLEKQNVNEAVKLQINILWDTPLISGDQSLLLDQLINSLILTNTDIAKLINRLESTPATEAQTTPELFNQEEIPPFFINNIRLYYARWLAQSELQDECLQVLEGIKPQDVVDPATLLFYQATGYHRILAKEKCLRAISLLQENNDAIPRRYATLANLMKAGRCSPFATDFTVIAPVTWCKFTPSKSSFLNRTAMVHTPSDSAIPSSFSALFRLP